MSDLAIPSVVALLPFVALLASGGSLLAWARTARRGRVALLVCGGALTSAGVFSVLGFVGTWIALLAGDDTAGRSPYSLVLAVFVAGIGFAAGATVGLLGGAIVAISGRSRRAAGSGRPS